MWRAAALHSRVQPAAARAEQPQTTIAKELGLAKATVRFHLKKLVASGGPYIGRGMIVELLGRSGVRVSELCDLKHGVRRAAPDGEASAVRR
jgi:DNA-binding Lrp family transcriptional regulator